MQNSEEEVDVHRVSTKKRCLVLDDDEEDFLEDNASQLAEIFGENIDVAFEPDTVPAVQQLTMDALFDEVPQTEDHWAKLFSQQADLEELDCGQVGDIFPLVREQHIIAAFGWRQQQVWTWFALSDSWTGPAKRG